MYGLEGCWAPLDSGNPQGPTVSWELEASAWCFLDPDPSSEEERQESVGVLSTS